jgi:hypothetical protein
MMVHEGETIHSGDFFTSTYIYERFRGDLGVLGGILGYFRGD